MPTFQTPEPITVTIERIVGDTRITASDRTDTVVDVRPSNESRAADVKAAAQIRVEYADSRLLVTAMKPWRHYSPFGNGGSIDLTIDLPTGSRVDGESPFGNFHGEGQLGDCRLKTAMGNIRLDHTGALQVNTSFGDIIVDSAAGDVDAATSSGELRLRKIDGAAVIKNSNGAIKLGDVTGDVQAKTANGDISVDRAHGSVVAKTARGDVRIGEVARGGVVLETALGELYVGIREGTAAWLDVSSQYGTVHNALEAFDRPEPSAATVEVRARTSYGDIVIGRPSPAKTFPAR